MMITRTLVASASALALTIGLAASAAAEGEWTGTLSVTSDYKFRGISQTDGDPALQGSVEYSWKWLTLGVWASNLDFSPTGDNGADIEVDLYASATYNFNEETAASFKVLYYAYPGSDVSDADYWEFFATLERDFGKFSGNVNLIYTPDYFGSTGDGFAVQGGVEVPVDDWISVSGNIGHQSFDDNVTIDLPDYLYGDVGFTVNYDIFSFDLRYVMTDVSNSDCYSTYGSAAADLCDNKVVATLSVSGSTAE